MIDLCNIAPDKPVLIAGPTASGKSDLALQIATQQGGVIVNADALQVFDGWRILTARPPAEDEARARHHLYGHVPFDAPYSTGQWLRDVAPYLSGQNSTEPRPIIVGGTGLNFMALTQGLAQIPATPADVRASADAMALDELQKGLDPATLARIDVQNRARVQRAWEVQQATGRSITDWQAETPPPLLAEADATCLVMQTDTDWLNARIERRFDIMLDLGALDEARAMLPHWDPSYVSSKAIGAPELIAHLNGTMTLNAARQAAIIASRQYAKRQRTWFRKRMKSWQPVLISSTS